MRRNSREGQLSCTKGGFDVLISLLHFLKSAFHSIAVAYPGIVTASRSPLRLKPAYGQSTFTECLVHLSLTWHGPQSATLGFLLGDLALRP
jgi:hypothetical protein